MSNLRLIAMYAAWVLAAGAIAVTVGVIVTELLSVVGLVDRFRSSYSRSLSLVTAIAFVGLALVPFIFRSRFADGMADTESP